MNRLLVYTNFKYLFPAYGYTVLKGAKLYQVLHAVVYFSPPSSNSNSVSPGPSTTGLQSRKKRHQTPYQTRLSFSRSLLLLLLLALRRPTRAGGHPIRQTARRVVRSDHGGVRAARHLGAPRFALVWLTASKNGIVSMSPAAPAPTLTATAAFAVRATIVDGERRACSGCGATRLESRRYSRRYYGGGEGRRGGSRHAGR